MNSHNASEEDTFKALKRIPFNQMFDIVSVWYNDLSDRRLMKTLLGDYGWGYVEFDQYRDEYRRKYHD